MKKEKIDLLIKCARKTIEAELKEDSYNPPLILLKDKELKEKRGTFVTITTNKGSLRGCIGHIEPVMSILDGVCSNAIQAAFHDPRFSPVHRSELENLVLEISILSKPQEIQYSKPGSFINKVIPGKHGVIFRLNYHIATFLPQVWEELKTPEVFFNQLSYKAGLLKPVWKTDPNLRVFTYYVEKSSE